MNENEGRDYRSVGEILREAREQRHWSLQQASARTRIPVRLVEAVEADDLERLSGPIYARGFVRSLGECYELDVDFLLTKLSAAGVADDPTQLKTPVPPVSPPPRAPSSGAVAGAGPPRGEDTTPVWTVESARVRRVAAPARRSPFRLLRPILGAVGLSVLAGLAWMQWGGEGGGASPPAGPSMALRPGGEGARAELAPRQDGSAGDREGAVAEPGSSEAVGGSTGLRAAGLHAGEDSEADAGPDTRRSDAAGSERAAEAAVEPEVVSDGVEVFDRESLPAALRSVEPEDVAEVAELRLTLQASGPLEVRWSADSRGEQRLVLRAGESRQLRAQDHFSLAVDDPSALRVLLDGRPYALPRPWDGSEILIPVAPAERR